MAKLTLRNARESDLEAFYQQQLDPEYNRMAAFGSANPEDKIAFMNHKHKILRDPSCLFYVIELNFEPIGNIASFFFDGERDWDMASQENTGAKALPPKLFRLLC
jgi:RimJ/RimL family protein N-acetyltransferase